MTLIETKESGAGKRAVTKAAVLFLAAFALYFLTHSPALDEIDAVQFAMGVRSFDLWHHQPHPPGYPLFILLGWLGTKFLHIGTESSLYLISALGGGIFVASCFLDSARAIDGKIRMVSRHIIADHSRRLDDSHKSRNSYAGRWPNERAISYCNLFFTTQKAQPDHLRWFSRGRRGGSSPAVVSGCRRDSRNSAEENRGECQDLVRCLCDVDRGLFALALADVVHVYTDDASFNREHYYFIDVAEFKRSMLIYPQHRRVRLYLVERRPSA